MAALFLFSSVAQAAPKHRVAIPQPPAPPDPPDPPDFPQPPDEDFDIEIPEINVHVPEINVHVPDFSGMIARGHGRNHDGDDDEDNDDDGDDQGSVERDEKGVHVYKMTPQRIHIPRVRVGRGDEDRWDERDATAQAHGKGSATLPVKGPVTFQLTLQAGDVAISTAPGSRVLVSLEGNADEEISLFAFGDRVQAVFRGRRSLRHGRLHVELPVGSRVDLSSMSGDVTAQKLAEVRVRSMSGDVKLQSVAKADVQTISGDVSIDDATGPVRLHTVSGKAVVSTEGPPQVEFQSASGDMEWSGACAKDCHLNAETVSGELRLTVDPRSSFALSYTSHSGELRDGIDLNVKRSASRKHGFSGGWLEATYGKGEGVIDADAFSGNLTLKKK